MDYLSQIFDTNTLAQIHQVLCNFFVEFYLGFFNHPEFIGLLFILFLIILLIISYRFFKNSKRYTYTTRFVLLFDMFYEKVFEFFEEIMGDKVTYNVKSYVVCMFFIILFSNLSGVLLDIVSPIFGTVMQLGESVYRLKTIIDIPTGNVNFNIAMAIVSMLIVLYLQYKTLGSVFKFLHEYIPVTGKGYITIPKMDNKILYYILRPIIKLLDIGMSLFLGLLDIIGVVAKIVSLSFRLFGNMMSGSLLMFMLVGGVIGATTFIHPEFKFPILVPIILILQGLLVGVIQAFVFPLLVGIFIKMSVDIEE